MSVRETHVNFRWKSLHHLEGKRTVLHEVDLDDRVDGLYARHRDSAEVIADLIFDAKNQNQGIRGIGASWSMSEVPYQKDNVIYNLDRFKIMKLVEDKYIHDRFKTGSKKYLFVQSGTKIKNINDWLRRRKLSLSTSGASNGQSIAGAVSTGTHGSAIDFGSVPDCVVGINIIKGPNKEDRVFIQRKGAKAVLKPEFAKEIGTVEVLDNDLFEAALVSIGSFGFVHSYVLAVENIYLLKRHIIRLKRKEALDWGSTMKFKDIQNHVPAEGRARPYHYKVYINPYKNDDVICELLYKKPYRTDYGDPVPFISKTSYPEVSMFVAQLASKVNGIVPKMVTLLTQSGFPNPNENPVEGTSGEIFWNTTLSGNFFGAAIGIDCADLPKAFDKVTKLMKEKGNVPALVALRFVKATAATIGFTRFKKTCILEVDGIPWKGHRNLIGYKTFLERLTNDLHAAGIEHTFHWGKNAAWWVPGLKDRCYGNRAKKWMEIRSDFLGKDYCKVFSNEFLETIGLHKFIDTSAGDPVEA